VQAVLEDAIASRAHHAVTISGAGRTDTGVHAGGQVAHFDTHSPIPADHWWRVLNNCLPEDVAILASAEVPRSWHSRFSATWRRYRYLLLNQEMPEVFWRPFSWQVRLPLNVKLMAGALQSILGENDLEAFRGAGSKRADSLVRVEQVECQRQHNLIWIEVQASGFLYRMMRLLVGALVYVGREQLSPAEFEHLWRCKDWSRVPSRWSAPPQGLCLIGVGYADNPFAIAAPTESPGAHVGARPGPAANFEIPVPWMALPRSS
jgi:tRNA pseudouridine38-40 synthase